MFSHWHRWAKHKSIQDTSFGWALNRHVHSKRFYLAVGAMLLEGPMDINPFMIYFPEKPGFKDRALIPSQRFLNDIKEANPGWSKGEIISRVQATRPVFTLLEASAEVAKSWSFDKCIGLASSFYVLSPIKEGPYLMALIARLKKSSLQVESYEEVVARGTKGLMSCSCSCFLHRAWCIHACVYGFKKKIITGFSRTMDPIRRDTGRAAPMQSPEQGHGWEFDYETGPDSQYKDPCNEPGFQESPPCGCRGGCARCAF